MPGAANGAMSGFFDNKNYHEGTIWGIDYISEPYALPKIRKLYLSE